MDRFRDAERPRGFEPIWVRRTVPSQDPWTGSRAKPRRLRGPDRVLDEHLEQIVLLRRELDLLIAHCHEAACDIDRELTNADQRALAFGLDLMAQGGPHAREELVHPERLRHEVVRTQIERLNLARLITPA